MKFALFFGACAATNLCGNWQQLSVGKCSTAVCCGNPNNTASPPSCLQPPTAGLALVNEETYTFAGDGNYDITVKIATGNSCPLGTSGTILFTVKTTGSYVSSGANTIVNDNWQKVTYTPTKFIATIDKSNKISFYRNGQIVGSPPQTIAPCMFMDDYMNNANYGCPCNTTWAPDGIDREINVSSCPAVNGNSSCPESYFFLRNLKYGNVRITNTTNNTRLLEITQPVTNQTAGWSSNVTYANFTADMSCPTSLTNRTYQSAAGHLTLALLPSFVAIATLVL